MNDARRWSRNLAVRGIFWRKCIDWVVLHTPSPCHPVLISVSALIFFFLAAPARRTVVKHLAVILPGSWKIMNYLRAFRVFQNFGWTMTDAAVHRLLKQPFSYELMGEENLKQLGGAHGAIVLTAHMGNYDLGAAIFAEKFQRELRIVRAPEPDALTARHLDLALEKSGAGAVKIDYNTDGTSLSFDLLNALRSGEIISIQGDRVIGEVAQSPVTLFGRRVLLPTGPFVLALVSQVPIYPLFVIRSGYRRYKIITHEPITCVRSNKSRDEDVGSAMQAWSGVLENEIMIHWRQWHAFTPVF